MNDMPEKNIPGGMNPGGGLVVSGASSPEQFPVLKAFQDFIEAERAQARKRVFQLSLTFATVLIVIVAAFFAIGISMFNNMSEMQTRLLDAALRREAAAARQPTAQPVVVQAPVPVAAQPAPIPAEVSKKLDELGMLADRMEKEKEARLEAMARKMEEMSRQNEELRRTLEKKEQSAIPGSGTQYTSRGVGILKPASFYRKPAAPAAAVNVETAPGKSVEAEVRPPAPVKKVEQPQPVAKKEKAPIESSKVNPPAPPKGMYSTRIKVGTQKGEEIPWSVMIPE